MSGYSSHISKVLKRYMWLVATMLDTTCLEHVHNPPKFNCQHSFSISRFSSISETSLTHPPIFTDSTCHPTMPPLSWSHCAQPWEYDRGPIWILIPTDVRWIPCWQLEPPVYSQCICEVSLLCVFSYALPAYTGLWRVSALLSNPATGTQIPSFLHEYGRYLYAKVWKKREHK